MTKCKKGRGLNPSPVATKTCIVGLPQQHNAGASLWKGIAKKSRKGKVSKTPTNRIFHSCYHPCSKDNMAKRKGGNNLDTW